MIKTITKTMRKNQLKKPLKLIHMQILTSAIQK